MEMRQRLANICMRLARLLNPKVLLVTRPTDGIAVSPNIERLNGSHNKNKTTTKERAGGNMVRHFKGVVVDMNRTVGFGYIKDLSGDDFYFFRMSQLSDEARKTKSLVNVGTKVEVDANEERGTVSSFSPSK